MMMRDDYSFRLARAVEAVGEARETHEHDREQREFERRLARRLRVINAAAQFQVNKDDLQSCVEDEAVIHEPALARRRPVS